MNPVDLRLAQFDSWLKTMELSGIADDISIIQVRVDQNQPVQGKTPNFNVTADTLDVARSWLNNTNFGGIAAAFGGQHKRANLFIFDADTQEVADKVDALLLQHLVSPCYATTRKGKHFYFTYDPLEVQPPGAKPGDGCDIRANRPILDGIKDVSVGCIILPGTVVYETQTQKRSMYQWHTDGGALPHLDAALYNALWALGNFDKKVTTQTQRPVATGATNEFRNVNAARWGFRKSKGYDNFYRWLSRNSIAATLEDGREGYFTALMYYVRTNYNANEQQCFDIAQLENEAWCRAGAKHTEGKGRFDDQVLTDKARRAVDRVEYVEPEERQDPTVIARSMADSLSNYIRFSNGANVLAGNYEYVDGLYNRRADDSENNDNLVRRFLTANDMESLCRNSFVAEVRKHFLYLLTERNPSNTVPDNHWLDGREDATCYIPMKSCLVDIKKYAEARAANIDTDEWRHEFTPTYFTEGKRNFDVDPSADCPTFKYFLEQLLPNESTRNEFQKHVGMILLPRNKVEHQVAMHLDGPPGSGKSTVLNILKHLVGKYSVVPYKDMVENTHEIMPLLNSELNIDGDVNSTMLDITTFNKVIEGATLTWNPKNKDLVTAAVTAHCVSAGNSFFSLSRDKASAGFWRRMRVYPCSATKEIQGLQSKLDKEMPGIFNWAAEGLADYIHNGLGQSDQMTTFIEEQKEKDSLHDFVANTCVTGPDKYTTRNTIYTAYEAFCRLYGYRPLSWNAFKERAVLAGFFVSDKPIAKRIPHLSAPARVFTGVEWVGDQSINADTSDIRKAMQADKLTPNPGANIIDMHGRTTTL